MWVTVTLLEDVPEIIGGWCPARKRGTVTDYPDVIAAQLLAKGTVELVEGVGQSGIGTNESPPIETADELREYLTKLEAEVHGNIEDQVAANREEQGDLYGG
jgi:hypothetical protein